MDGIGKISAIGDVTGKVAALRPVGPAGRENPTPREAAAKEAAAAPEAASAPRKEDPFQRASDALSELFAERLTNSKLRIDLDRDAGRFVYQAVDINSGEVVQQFPAEEMLRILSFYRKEAGLVVDDKA